MIAADVIVVARWGHGWLGLPGWGVFLFILLVFALTTGGDRGGKS